jgi:hypothetical protein
MRRVLLVAAAMVSAAAGARAESFTVTMEGGAEADTNVERVETGPGMADRITAPVGRAGGRIDHKGRLLGGSYVVGASALARMVASSRMRTGPENVMLYAGEIRWLHEIPSRPVAVGFHLLGANTLALTDDRGARTFRNLGGDALAMLGTGDDRRVTLAVGARDFVYKPDHAFDWRGPVASARLDLPLWHGAGKTRSLELAATLAFEARTYEGVARINVCPPDASPNIECSKETSLVRRDRYQRAGVELGWTGEVVATTGYQLTVIDSNSHGQSLLRHRIMASATAELIDKLFGSATATLQIDQYLDGLLVETAVEDQEFTSLEDENRSSLQVRLARELSTAWSLEARAAVWRNLGSAVAASFRRELIYAGVIYSH